MSERTFYVTFGSGQYPADPWPLPAEHWNGWLEVTVDDSGIDPDECDCEHVTTTACSQCCECEPCSADRAEVLARMIVVGAIGRQWSSIYPADEWDPTPFPLGCIATLP